MVRGLWIFFVFMVFVFNLDNAYARKHKKSKVVKTLVEKGIGGIELGNSTTTTKIIDKKKLDILYESNKDVIATSGLGIQTHNDNELVILFPHPNDQKYEFSEVAITRKDQIGERKPAMVEPFTVVGMTEHNLRLGAQMKEVSNSLGKPTRIEKDDNKVIWTYKVQPQQDRSGFLYKAEKSGFFHKITFINGQATEIRFGFLNQ